MSTYMSIKGVKSHLSSLVDRNRILLLKSPLMEDFGEDLQEKLMAISTVKEYSTGQPLFLDGDSIDCIYYVISGKVKEYYCNRAGEDCLRRIIIAGSYISLHQLYATPLSYSYTCEAITASCCLAVRLEPFQKLAEQTPELSFRVCRLISEYMENTCRLNCICKKKQATSRVAAYLLSKHNIRCKDVRFCVYRATTKNIVDIKPLSLTAHDVCLARETFSRALSQLQSFGLIDVQKGVVELLDLEGLKTTCGAE